MNKELFNTAPTYWNPFKSFPVVEEGPSIKMEVYKLYWISLRSITGSDDSTLLWFIIQSMRYAFREHQIHLDKTTLNRMLTGSSSVPGPRAKISRSIKNLESLGLLEVTFRYGNASGYQPNLYETKRFDLLPEFVSNVSEDFQDSSVSGLASLQSLDSKSLIRKFKLPKFKNSNIRFRMSNQFSDSISISVQSLDQSLDSKSLNQSLDSKSLKPRKASKPNKTSTETPPPINLSTLEKKGESKDLKHNDLDPKNGLDEIEALETQRNPMKPNEISTETSAPINLSTLEKKGESKDLKHNDLDPKNGLEEITADESLRKWILEVLFPRFRNLEIDSNEYGNYADRRIMEPGIKKDDVAPYEWVSERMKLAPNIRGERITHTFCYLEKEQREFVRFEGEKPKQLFDIHNSRCWMLLKILEDSGAVSSKEDMEFFGYFVKGNLTYEEVWMDGNGLTELTYSQRKDAKKDMQTFLCSKNIRFKTQNNRSYEYFRKYMPSIADYVIENRRQLKLYWDTTRKETETMCSLARVLEEKYGVKCIVLYDGLFCKESECTPKNIEIANAEFEKLLNNQRSIL